MLFNFDFGIEILLLSVVKTFPESLLSPEGENLYWRFLSYFVLTFKVYARLLSWQLIPDTLMWG